VIHRSLPTVDQSADRVNNCGLLTYVKQLDKYDRSPRF